MPEPNSRHVVAQSSSSSDSSEDEEEARKIAAAVCDNSILQLFNKNKASEGKSDTQGLRPQRDGLSSRGTSALPVPMKSNRPMDVNDDDKNNVLHTTPEFRHHVSKQLSGMLENKLCETVDDGVWNKTAPEASQDNGIKLFSDSKGLFKLEASNECDEEAMSKNSQPSRKKKRKIRLSTSSSESDEDDKIQACVQTADEIERQGELLSRVEPVTGTMHKGTASPALTRWLKTEAARAEASKDNGQTSCPDTTKTKKKKKKKKKKKSSDLVNTNVSVS